MDNFYINDYKSLYSQKVFEVGGDRNEYIIFSIEGKERLRIGKDKFYIDGKPTEDHKRIYGAFVDWLIKQNLYKTKPKFRIRMKKKEKPGEEV